MLRYAIRDTQVEARTAKSSVMQHTLKGVVFIAAHLLAVFCCSYRVRLYKRVSERISRQSIIAQLAQDCMRSTFD